MSKRESSAIAALQRLWADMPLSNENFQTDNANAERFVLMQRGKVRYCHELRKWLVWDGRRWVMDDGGRAMELAKDTARTLIGFAGTDSRVLGFAQSCNNRGRLDAMLALAKSHPDLAIESDKLDSDPWLLNCTNGTLDLRTLQLSQHNPKQLLTKLCPTDYEPAADSVVWNHFVETTIPDSECRQFIQRFCGYSLTGETREQKFLVLLGNGSNGKSVLLDACLSVLGSDYAMQGSPDLLVDKPRDTHPTTRMDLFGKRLAVCTETEQGQRLAESLLKSLTGSDPICGRRMRQDNWQFRPTHKLILCTNHMPKLSGDDDAVWRRVIVVNFTERFWDSDANETGPESHRQDKFLAKKLRGDSAAILAWMVQGCRLWHAEGLRIPQSILQATSDCRYEVDTFRQFIHERFEVDSAYRITAAALQKAYKSFCDERSEKELSAKKLAARLQSMGFDKTKSSFVFYLGLRLKQTKTATPKHPLPNQTPRG